MPEQKIRMLIVIAHLVQSGSERFTYELCKAIDRDRFDIELLTKWRVRPSDYYYEKLRELGVPIHRRLPILLNRLQRHARPFYLLSRPLLEFAHRWYARMFIGRLLKRFDVISTIQIENYYLLQPLLKNNNRVVIYLMSNAFQYRFDPYADCKRGRSYRFVINDPTMVDDYNRACPAAESYFFPLALDLSGRADLSNCARVESPYDIGVFIRLSPTRPIGGLFEALSHLLKAKDARLRVWGRGNPAQFNAELGRLGIADRVIFEGHTQSIEQTIREAGLSMIWMTCNGTTIGYASIELGSFGMPMMFWNLSNVNDREVAEQTGGSLQTFQNPADLAAATSQALDDPELCRAKGRALRQYIFDTYEITNHIRGLEDYLERVDSEATSGPW